MVVQNKIMHNNYSATLPKFLYNLLMLHRWSVIFLDYRTLLPVMFLNVNLNHKFKIFNDYNENLGIKIFNETFFKKDNS